MLSPEAGQLALRAGGQFDVAEPRLAGGGGVETAKDVEERGLAATGGPQKDGHFPLVEVDVHTTQGMHLDLAGAIDLGQLSAMNDALGHIVAPVSGHCPCNRQVAP
jgi:hypothetical protein